MNQKFKTLILIASVLGTIAVIMGAFGAHALKGRISPESLDAYNTGLDYHFIHTLVIFAVAFLYRVYRIKGLYIIGLIFLIGIILFSGSIYILSLKAIIGIGSIGPFGLVIPIGGLILVGAWAAIFFTIIKIKT